MEKQMQTANPSAPDYDRQADREWFNQRLANARIHNSELERKIAGYRAALKGIADIEPGSRGAYSKFVDAQNRAKAALGEPANGCAIDGN
jgi:hypothetical protein